MTEVKVNNSSERPPEEFILKLEADCERHIGHDKYCFFVPLEIGSFVVYCWTKEKLPSNKLKRVHLTENIIKNNEYSRILQKEDSLDYGMAIYEGGEIIDPTQDRRFRKFDWVKNTRCWVEKTFSKREILKALQDIMTIVK